MEDHEDFDDKGPVPEDNIDYWAEDDSKECKNCYTSLSLEYPLEWGDPPYYCGACMTDEFDKARKVVTKAADDIWAIAEGKASGSERDLKRISSVLHDIRAGRDTDWYMK